MSPFLARAWTVARTPRAESSARRKQPPTWWRVPLEEQCVALGAAPHPACLCFPAYTRWLEAKLPKAKSTEAHPEKIVTGGGGVAPSAECRGSLQKNFDPVWYRAS